MSDLSALTRLAVTPLVLAALGLSTLAAPAAHAATLDAAATSAAAAAPRSASPSSATSPDTGTGTTAFSSVKPKVFSFENGKPSGWKGTGAAHLTVGTGAARTGAYSLLATGLGQSPAALSWNRALSAFPGTGTWYHLQVPVRVVSGNPGMIWIRVQGASDLAATAVAVDSSSWTAVDAWFVPADGAAAVTFTLEQAPQTDCGPTTGPLGTVSLDDVLLIRAEDLPDTAPPAANAVVPGEPGSGGWGGEVPDPGSEGRSPGRVAPACVAE